MGEPGIGKSRLVHEFENWVDLLPQRFRFFRGQATADMPASPFALMRDVFAARFNIQDNDSAAVARSEEHTSELQSQSNLVCRLLLERKEAIRSRSGCGAACGAAVRRCWST